MKYEDVSAIILAGGKSSRMGRSKASLMWGGVTLIEHQVCKMRALGIEDIIVCGCTKPVEGTRYVADKYMHKGPLGGIHAGLLAADNAHCLVTGVDTPLVPVSALKMLIDKHIPSGSRVTVLAHGDSIEPLMGVYERDLSALAEDILQTEHTSVRVLLRRAGVKTVPFDGNESLLCDCNTPEEFRKACSIMSCSGAASICN